MLAKGKEDAFQNLKRLMERPDVTELVNACDAGREGELIFRLVYEAAGCSKPFSRLWISSMGGRGDPGGLCRPAPRAGPMIPCISRRSAAKRRTGSLVSTRAAWFSVLYHRTLNVGRVQTPTLAMLVDRDSRITLFRKEKYHHVRLALDGAEAVSEKIAAPEEAESLRAACAGASASCTSVTHEKKKGGAAQALRPDRLAAGGKPGVRLHGQADPGLCTIAVREEAADLSPDRQPVSDGRYGGDRLCGSASGSAGAALRCLPGLLP